jgi:hypothetical protein
MFGEMSWDVGPQTPWIVGSASRDGTGEAAQMSSAFGYVYNAKNIRHAINSEPFIREDGTPGTVPLTDVSLGSYHPGGCMVAMSDGSAFFIRDELDVTVLRRMASRASEDVYERP